MGKAIFIDTTGSHKIRVVIEGDGKRIEESAERAANAQAVLPMIEALCKKSNLKLTDITEIKVNTGPGSYTGLRVGITVANMLGALLGVPINGLPVGETVTPVYKGDRW